VPPAPTPREQALSAASNAFRVAWAVADDIHRLAWLDVLRSPGDWNTSNLPGIVGAGAAPHFADTLPFWSKVLGMTVHQRAHINPASVDPSTQPVTEIDAGISEGVVRKLSQGMNAMPDSEAAATNLETTLATPAERAAAATVPAETELLIRLVLRRIGSITTGEPRDLQVVQTLSADGEDLSKVLRARAPAACTF
jgi:hypothetical protein